MYNRYIPNGTTYTRISMEDGPEYEAAGGKTEEKSRSRVDEPHRPSGSGRGGFRLPSFLTGEGNSGGLGSLLNALNLENLDSGDILLLLIVLLLLWEGDDLELVIALGLVLILCLGEDTGQPSE